MSSKDATPELIAEYTSKLFDKYERLKAGDERVPFWDLVVVCCSADAGVEAAFRQCISQHVLPPGATYRVIADPPGLQVECGGATMHVLKILTDELADRLASMKILMIHAGGFSKRLVQHAVLGKLFSPLPVGERGVSMLELKLTMYLPYAELLPPGVLVTGCDDMQLAWLPDTLPDDLFVDKPDGFVALAHPAPISVAVNHGVYVLPSTEGKDNQSCRVSPCEEVLQKPSIQLMRNRGAAFIEDGRETVHIDGAFWMGGGAVRRLLQLWRRLQPLREELSAYRDFLPCLGRRSDSHYQSVVASMDPQSARAVTNALLRGTDLRVLVVPRSRFFHIGTVLEYMCHLVGGGALTPALRLRRWCHAVGPGHTAGVVMHSVLSAGTQMPETSLVEYSRLDGDVSVGEGTLVSHVHVTGSVRIPAGVLLHTAAVVVGGVTKHVTLALGVTDDVKAGRSILGGDIVCDKTPPEDAQLDVDNSVKCYVTLWNARLFPDADTMTESVVKTLTMLSPGPPYRCSDELWSICDVVQHRDPMSMLAFRDQVCRDVDAVLTGKSVS